MFKVEILKPMDISASLPLSLALILVAIWVIFWLMLILCCCICKCCCKKKTKVGQQIKKIPNSYKVELSVRYETKLGQELFVVGSIPELGNWEEFTCKMTWTEGHVWVSQDLFVQNTSTFQYKFVVNNPQDTEVSKNQIWESGFDRIANLTILDDKSPKLASVKTVEIFDEWETFYIEFVVSHPKKNEQVVISGSKEELGDWKQ